MYHHAQGPLLMKASKVFKSSLRKGLFLAVFSAKLPKTLEIKSVTSQIVAKRQPLEAENRGFASLLKAARNKSPLHNQQVALSLTDLVLDAAMRIGGLVLHHPVGNSPIQDGSQNSAMH